MVLKPISRIITVENELTTPLGIALQKEGTSDPNVQSEQELTSKSIYLSHQKDANGDGNTYAANTEVKSRMVLGSENPNRICFLSKALFLIPVSFPATRVTAMRRSRWLRNLAEDGESGRKHQMIMAQRQVAPPSCQMSVSDFIHHSFRRLFFWIERDAQCRKSAPSARVSYRQGAQRHPWKYRIRSRSEYKY